MHNTVTNFYNLQTPESYENSHRARLDFLVKDLELDKIKDSVIYDFGGGCGSLFNRLPTNTNNLCYILDGADISVLTHTYLRVDLNNPFAKSILTNYPQADVAFCFETLEHLPNPYNCLAEIKSILKEDHILYLSIPNIATTHNTLYPGLLYPVDNFKEFLRQMAFEILDHRLHNKSFHQEVFILKNKNWNFSQMKFYKHENKFRGIPPIEAINL